MGGSFWLCGVIIFLCFLTCGGSSSTSVMSYTTTTLSSVTSSASANMSTSATVTSQSSDVGTSTITPPLQVGAYSTSASITLMTNVTPTTSISASTTATAPKDSPTTRASEGTEFWEKAIDLATPLGTFIIVVVSVVLLLIFLVALVVVCCKYRRLKERTGFPDHMAISDSEWMRSNNDLMMWERNLRASEVKTNNGISNRPFNEKRD